MTKRKRTGVRKVYREQLIRCLLDIIESGGSLPGRSTYSMLIGLSRAGLHAHFNTADVTEIELEALERHRAAHVRSSLKADRALEREIDEGSVPAIKLHYQKAEKWNPATEVKLGLDIININID